MAALAVPEDPHVTRLIREHHCPDYILGKSEDELLHMSHSGFDAATEQLFITNLRMYLSISRRYSIEQGEAVGIAYLGFHRALARWDAGKGAGFSAYSAFWVRSYLSAYRRGNTTIRIPLHLYSLMNAVRVAADRIKEQEGTTPTLKEVITRMDLKQKQKATLLQAFNIHFGQPAFDDEDALHMIIAAAKSQEDELETQELKQHVQWCTKQLDRRSRRVIHKRFTLEQSLTTTAKEMGCARQSVLNTQNKALRELERCLKEAWQ